MAPSLAAPPGAAGDAAAPGRQGMETPPEGCILAGDEVALVFDERAQRQAFPALGDPDPIAWLFAQARPEPEGR